MPVKSLEAGVRTLQGVPGVAIIDLNGEIDGLAEDELNAAYNAVPEGPGPVILNFRNVDYINSTGIALIVGLLGRARKVGRRLLACSLSNHYVEIFTITRLADFMGTYDNEMSALAATATGDG